MITIKNGVILYGETLTPFKGNISIDQNQIIEVSKTASGGEIIDAKGCIVSPTLINSHIHIGDSVAPDIGDGESLEKIVKPPNGIKHKILESISREELIKSIKESLTYMILNGTSTFVDFREGGIMGLEILKEALYESPFRSVVLGRDNSFFETEISASNLEKGVEKILKLGDGVGLSGFGEISDANAKIIAKSCHDAHKIAAIHVAENSSVQRDSIKLTDKSEVQRAIEADFNLLIHLTAASKSDLDLLSAQQISVVCCPRANGALSTGIPPLIDMWKQNINLLLGTDNVMFNAPNMFREMEYALKVTRGYYKEYFPPVEILKMATVNASKAFHKNIGILKEGYLADVMIVDQLSSNPYLSLINRTESKNIIGLITDGKIIYQR